MNILKKIKSYAGMKIREREENYIEKTICRERNKNFVERNIGIKVLERKKVRKMNLLEKDVSKRKKMSSTFYIYIKKKLLLISKTVLKKHKTKNKIGYHTTLVLK